MSALDLIAGITPPANEEAEQALLGAILVNNRAYEKVSDLLRPEHFHDPVHQRIYAAIAKTIDAGRMASPVTLRAMFDADEGLAGEGGGGYLAELAGNLVTIINARDYARTICDAFLRRELIEVGLEMVADAAAEDIDRPAEKRLEEAEGRLYELAERRGGARGSVALIDALSQADEIIDKAQRAADGITGVPSGLVELDRRLGGFQPAELYVLAGRPSMGKTALGLTIAANAARAGHPVLFFSLEMSAAQLAMRVYAQSTGISVQQQRSRLEPQQFATLAQARGELLNVPLHIEDGGAMTLPQMRAAARKQKRRGGLAMVVIDYLGLARPTDARLQKVHQIEEITTGLKALSKELDIPVLLLAQLSRAVEQREDKRPMLSDLRDSGAIEQDADTVMFVYREEYYLEREQPQPGHDQAKWADAMTGWSNRMGACQGVAEVITAKFRQGEIGTDRMRFDGARQLFENLAYSEH